MARTQAVRVTRAARLGLAALVAIVLAGIGIYFAVQRTTSGYKIGVHFAQAAGVAPGAQVYLNGVVVGGVTKVKILPDTTVDFIINILRNTDIPKNAQFSVQASLTGAPSVIISVPPGAAGANGLLPRHVLPVAQQPSGTQPLTLETFMGQNQVLGNRALHVLALARPYGKPMIQHLQHARASGGAIMGELPTLRPDLMGSVQSTIARAKANVQDAQAALNDRDRPKLAAIASEFGRSAGDMQKTSQALASLKHDPRLQSQVRTATVQLRAVVANMAKLSSDMQNIAGNSQTKAELRDAGARLRALLHKI